MNTAVLVVLTLGLLGATFGAAHNLPRLARHGGGMVTIALR